MNDKADAPPASRLERIGDYVVTKPLGDGGMGTVYAAQERLSGRPVALKVLHRHLTAKQDARERFFEEMRILARLEHPNIVRSLNSLEADGKLVLVLELLEGHTLRDEIAGAGALRPIRAMEIASAVASALVAAHEQREPIVHRDLKPENLMVLRDGTVKVMDFGISKILASGGPTHTTQLVGTVSYMSPEQIEARSIGPAVDLYALGVILYEMLSGKQPFTGESVLSVLKQHMEAPVPPLPDSVRDEISSDLEKLVWRLLEKQPADRPASARDVLSELERIRGLASTLVPTASQTGLPTPARLVPSSSGGSSAGPVTGSTSPGKPKVDTIDLVGRFEKRSAWKLVALAAAVLAIGVGGFFAWTYGFDAAPKKASASPRSATASAPVAPAPTVAAPAAPAGHPEGDKWLAWTVPITWVEFQGGGTPKFGTYKIPHAPGETEDGEFEVRIFSGGSVDPLGIQRSEFDLCPGCESKTAITAANVPADLIELRGDYWYPGTRPRKGATPKTKFARLVVLLPVGEATYMFRATGPEATIAAAKADFTGMLAGVRYLR